MNSPTNTTHILDSHFRVERSTYTEDDGTLFYSDTLFEDDEPVLSVDSVDFTPEEVFEEYRRIEALDR